MRTSLQTVRGGALLALVAMLAGIPIAHAAGRMPAAHRYEISGSLQPAAAAKAIASGALGVNGRLSAPAKDVGLQSGGDFVVMAKLAESPLGCSGNDTIFVDGFDGQ
jgi:hypothetical protein